MNGTRSEIDHYIRMSEEVFCPIYPYLCDSLLDRVSLPIEQMRVIDLGGGSGLWLEAMLDKGAASGTLIDASEQMITYAKSRIAEKFTSEQFCAITGLADKIPLADASHNVVISRSSMHMWANLEKCWQEMFRVLSDSGIAFLGRGYGPDLPDEIRQAVKMARKKIRTEEQSDFKEEPASPEPTTIVNMAFETGFKEVSLIKDNKAVWILAQK